MDINPPPSSLPGRVGCERIQGLIRTPRERKVLEKPAWTTTNEKDENRCGGRISGAAGDGTPITILNIRLQRADRAGS